MRVCLLNIASHLRSIFADKCEAIWSHDTLHIVEERTERFSTGELRVACEEVQGKRIHPNASRSQILQTLDIHLKHQAVMNIDPAIGRRFPQSAY